MEQNKTSNQKPHAHEVKASIIVTVYNEEAFLAECLDSLLGQDEKCIEIIIVDDASTDKSLSISRTYAARDKRVRIICNEKNMGLIESRNRGMAHVTGKYVMLVDADDFISHDAVSLALHALNQNNADTAVLNLQMYYSPQDIRPYSTYAPKESITPKQAFIMCMEGKLHGLCLEAAAHYKEIPFDCSCRLYSDDNTAKLHYLISRRICFCDGKYFYRQHASSETHKISIARFDYLKANMSLKKQLQALHASTEVMSAVEIHRWKNIVAHYRLLKENDAAFSPTDYKKAMAIIEKAIKATDFSLLPLSLKVRLPYWPAKTLHKFVIWQKIYYALHRIYRKAFG